MVPADQVIAEAKALGMKIAAKPPLAVKLAKQAVHKAYELPLTEAVDLERKLFYLLFSTEDAKEGISAFIEKRQPSFTGR